jgi:hypothetical protein
MIFWIVFIVIAMIGYGLTIMVFLDSEYNTGSYLPDFNLMFAFLIFIMTTIILGLLLAGKYLF